MKAKEMSRLFKIDKRCPFCNCKLHIGLLLHEKSGEFFARLLCNNHLYKGKKKSIAFEEGWRDLSLLIDEFKKGNLSVKRETVRYKRFKEKYQIN